MAGGETGYLDPLAGLLADLDTIASEASAGFGSRREYRLEPGETRPAAILFLDVVGFTGLARKLNTEHLSRLIDRTFRIFDLTVRAEGGYCDKVIGDAGLYVFAGHPNFAPACEAALNCALTVRERIRRINTSLAHSGMTIAVRGGISFGEVTRQRIGGDAQQVTVMGEAVNLAQRLENTAAPGVIQTVQSVLAEAGEKFASTPLF
jgi:class 3 adenylate cyclase